ncbi:sialate O-acetylesterase [Pararcticibacter amylolyticus]|uniref:Sialate O-acetylesterase n=1 Tax=Pararcticibacter amylolyticus TaxID=2173175 RepID=A0A2U2PIY5_9SPHI|nr:sialate O-acetylesterase [Pararcticibacter amylolyticus]PWG81340.1 sialate O-acetylesterase [Pararcticibacter amylolyticus]
MQRIKIFFSSLILSAVLSFSASAQVRLPQIIRDSMILQRNAPLKLWGWASPGEKVRIRFNGKSAAGKTSPGGRWQVQLPAMKAGGPYTMTVSGKNTIVLKEILIGDVWVCSGQSNMVHQLAIHNITYAKDIETADYPQIRQFWIPTTTRLEGPAADLPPGNWKSANPKDVNTFSAVAYFFARNIFERHHVPVGIINASVGGTTIEAWTGEDGLSGFPGIKEVITRNKDTAWVMSQKRRQPAGNTARMKDADKGTSGPVSWFDPSYVPKGWQAFDVPGYWEDQGIRDLDGVVWFRKEFELPVHVAGKKASLFMGRIVDADIAYLNGKQVGSTSYLYPQRRYQVPEGVLKAGKNILVVRVQNNSGKGGFVPVKPYFLKVEDVEVDLKGDWEYKVGQVYRRDNASRGFYAFSEQSQPASLFNAMIAPFTSYAVKGVLWYQGESNTGNAQEYGKLLPALIADWRKQFGRANLPFYYVQLPNFGDAVYLPSESGSAVIREAALKTLSVPNTGMAVTIDLGEWNDIHPDNKKDVGERLALIARHFLYGEKDLVFSGPLYQSSRIEGNKIIVSFLHTGGGLISIDGEPLSQFAIAGADRKFVWANARITGDKVEVWSDEVPQPEFVRYAWADNPVGPNLYNVEKLPASPFRTDE